LVLVETTAPENTRYHLLETIRQYAQEKLDKSGELTVVREQHLSYYLTLTEQAEPELVKPQQARWLNLLSREHENWRTALCWAAESSKPAELLQLSGALGQFWYLSGHWKEGQQWLVMALRNSEPLPKLHQARAWGWV